MDYGGVITAIEEGDISFAATVGLLLIVFLCFRLDCVLLLGTEQHETEITEKRMIFVSYVGFSNYATLLLPVWLYCTINWV